MKSDWKDRLGIFLSMLCLVHCLLTPVIVGLLPVGAFIGLWHHGFHRLFLFMVLGAGLFAFLPGWRVHRDVRVWTWGGTGVIFLAIGAYASPEHSHFDLQSTLWILPTVLGGISMIRAHYLNRQLIGCRAGIT